MFPRLQLTDIFRVSLRLCCRKITVSFRKYTVSSESGFEAGLQPAIQLPRTSVFLSLLFRDLILGEHASSLAAMLQAPIDRSMRARESPIDEN